MQVSDPFQTVAFLLILIMSVIVHEVTHGYVAEMLGDPTAKLSGRLTLNPFSHLDLVGSFIVPLFMMLAGGPVFGWAKLVPYNPYNLRGGRWGPAMVAIAGPLSNLFLATFFSQLFIYKVFDTAGANNLLVGAIFINLVLFVVNMMPVPPIDGSKIIFALIPDRFYFVVETIEKYSLVFILILILFIDAILSPAVNLLFYTLTSIKFL
ncbi:site-2 protease family protein [Candidatus Gottesmanbacteria bacterium]|nr:site-2 protease family protein [Candidatus Gottesmanbacteria bacterium]